MIDLERTLQDQNVTSCVVLIPEYTHFKLYLMSVFTDYVINIAG